MWHLTKIPRRVHFYWGGERLSYLRYLTVKTFCLLNPDWQVQLHVPRIVSHSLPKWQTFQQKNSNVVKDYRDHVNVEIKVHDFSDYGFDNYAHEVHKSDFLRWYLLSEHGGVWSDMDIVYTRPMSNLQDNHPNNATIDTALCPLAAPKKHTVGFLLTSQKNNFATWMHHISRAEYDPEHYQCMGSDILNKNFTSLDDFSKLFPDNHFSFLDKNSVYAVTSKDIDRFYQPMDRTAEKKLYNSRVVGFHWFGGHPLSQEFENHLTESNLSKFDYFLSKIIEQALS